MNDKNRLISADILMPEILNLVNDGHKASFIVTGMSMWPFICSGRDQVIIESCNIYDIHVGDIVLLQTPLCNYLLHRVTNIKKDSFETTGDGNCFRDGYFTYECLKARVTELIRKNRTINCNSLYWKFIFRIWMVLFPFRNILLKLLRFISRIKHKINNELSKR